jgi:hypothetical protein
VRREKLKLQTVMILKEAFDEITAHLEEDSHLSSRFMEKIAFSVSSGKSENLTTKIYFQKILQYLKLQ